MTAERILALRQLWREAFGDADEFLDAFFSTVFSPDRFHCVLEDDQPVSALYWLDCELKGHKLAYVYAVATLKSHRGQGLAQQLMAETHEILCTRGYSGVVLVPEKAHLFDFYRKLGYQAACTVTEFSCPWADTPVPLRQISAEEYAHLRESRLPDGGVIQTGEVLAFLQSYARFYAGEDFLLVAELEGNKLFSQELLGDPQAAPGILRSLNCPTGCFRTPGNGRELAMFLPLTESCPAPAYLGLALD